MVRQFAAADNEDLQGSEAADVYVKRFKSKNDYVKELQRFPSTSRTLNRSYRRRSSSIVEIVLMQEDDVESQEDDNKKEWSNEDLRFRSWESICRHHEESETKLYDPDDEILPNPSKYDNVMRWTKTK